MPDLGEFATSGIKSLPVKGTRQHNINLRLVLACQIPIKKPDMRQNVACPLVSPHFYTFKAKRQERAIENQRKANAMERIRDDIIRIRNVVQPTAKRLMRLHHKKVNIPSQVCRDTLSATRVQRPPLRLIGEPQHIRDDLSSCLLHSFDLKLPTIGICIKKQCRIGCPQALDSTPLS